MTIDADFVNAIDEIAQRAAKAENRKPFELTVGQRLILFTPNENGTWDEKEERRIEPSPTVMNLATLDGLAAYLKDNRDALTLAGLIVVIGGPTSVGIISKLEGDEMERKTYVHCNAETLTPRQGPKFGEYVEHEAFAIWLMSQFTPTEDSKAILKLVGNVTDSAVKTSTDDGISQTVEAKAGIVGRTDVVVPNPVRLRPFRTFREIDQPESLFLFRMRRGAEGQKPTMALFEADGLSWRLEAVRGIQKYLAAKVGKDVTVIA